MITTKIKKYRKKKNITQAELASSINVSRKTLSLIEKGNLIPKIDIAYKLSLILDATVQELFHDEEYNTFCLKKQEETFNKITDLYFKVSK